MSYHYFIWFNCGWIVFTKLQICLVNVINSVCLSILAWAWLSFQLCTEGDLEGSGYFCFKRVFTGCLPEFWGCLCTQLSCRKIVSFSVPRVLILFLYWEEAFSLLKLKYNFLFLFCFWNVCKTMIITSHNDIISQDNSFSK